MFRMSHVPGFNVSARLLLGSSCMAFAGSLIAGTAKTLDWSGKAGCPHPKSKRTMEAMQARRLRLS